MNSAVPNPQPSIPAPSGHPAAPGRKRVMLVDDHPMMRAGLAHLVSDQPDLEVCCEAGSPAEALGELSRCHPDLILADITMPGRSGLEFIKDLHALDAGAAVLVVSMQEEAFYAERALRAGARGFIMKDAGARQMLIAMRKVLAGGVYVSAAISAKLVDSFASPYPRSSHPSVDRLTDREFEILRMIGDGLEPKAIAQVLQVSRKTVDVHRANLKKKLGLKSNAELVRHAVRSLEATRPEG